VTLGSEDDPEPASDDDARGEPAFD
jgi:hypothetical protein